MSFAITVETFNKAMEELVRNLPGLETFLANQPYTIYEMIGGGFPRWVVEFMRDNSRAPTFDEALEQYLHKHGDVDIKLQPDRFCCGESSRRFNELITTLRKIPGTVIEFSGNDYTGKFAEQFNDNMVQTTTYYGFYRMYVIVPRTLSTGEILDRYIHYDVLYMKETSGIFRFDYTINTLFYPKMKESGQKCINDIVNKRLVDAGLLFEDDHPWFSLKKLWRAGRFFKNGYVMEPSENVLKSIETTFIACTTGLSDSDEPVKKDRVRICTSDDSKPSVSLSLYGRGLTAHRMIVSRHTYTNLTIDYVLKDTNFIAFYKSIGGDINRLHEVVVIAST